MAQQNAISLYVIAGNILYICPGVLGELLSFQPNCSLPESGVQTSFVASPNVRGSWQLVSTCLFTLFVCSYQVVHMNIPLPAKDKKSGQRPLWKCWWWALVAVITPEVVLVDSWHTLHQAQKQLRNLDDNARRSWTLTHVFYANMGGLFIQSRFGSLTLKGSLLPQAYQCHVLNREPPITLDEIHEKSGDDLFSRAIAMCQIIFFSVQIFTRIRQGLAISQLELGVVSVAAYSLVSYTCLWYKPKNISLPTVVVLSEEEIERLVAIDSTSHQQLTQPVWSLGTAFRAPKRDGEVSGGAVNTIWMTLTVIPLGIFHLAGWNFSFPTHVDKWLWRAASITVTAFPIVLLWIGINAVVFEHVKLLFRLFFLLMVLTMALFLLARVVLVVEMFRCVLYLPPSAFAVASWTQSIAHFS